MKGKIIRGVGGFYYVHTGDGLIFECRAKGIFRRENIKPLVGDDVEIAVIDPGQRTGNIDQILPRKNTLIRPAAANVDQALVIFAAASPRPNLNLLDRFLISMEQQKIPVLIGFNKTDLVDESQQSELEAIYRNCGSHVFLLSVAGLKGIELLKEKLTGRTTIVAGPSGVGKSSLTNTLLRQAKMEVGEVSRKIDRGRHTTRHTELIALGDSTYFLDTPGFSSLYLQGIEYGELKDYFDEFREYEPRCRFQGCMHIHEPDCAVKSAVEAGNIHRSRYENYVLLAEELKNRKKY